MDWNTELLSWPAQCEGDVEVPGFPAEGIAIEFVPFLFYGPEQGFPP